MKRFTENLTLTDISVTLTEEDIVTLMKRKPISFLNKDGQPTLTAVTLQTCRQKVEIITPLVALNFGGVIPYQLGMNIITLSDLDVDSSLNKVIFQLYRLKGLYSTLARNILRQVPFTITALGYISVTICAKVNYMTRP